MIILNRNRINIPFIKQRYCHMKQDMHTLLQKTYLTFKDTNKLKVMPYI